MAMTTAMKGRTAVITGAASGIGLAIARRYARDGARVVLSDLQSNVGEAHTQSLRDSGHQAWFVACDASDERQVEHLVQTAEQLAGAVDIAVCSAGISGQTGAFHQIEASELRHVLDVNLVGPYLLGKAVARRMIEAGRGGVIIHISSVGAVLGVADSFAYCVSKAGLAMLTKTMALSLADKGIRVNAIGPGPTESPMMVDLPPAMRQTMLSRTPMGRFAEAEEMAGIAAFLAGPDSGYITGQTIYADGGRLALNYVVPPKANGARP